MTDQRREFTAMYAQVDVANRDEFALLGVEALVDVVDDQMKWVRHNVLRFY